MKKLDTVILTVSFWFSIITYAQKIDSINPSEEKIKVNKVFDEHGNLIRYDSIYSYSSSNYNMDTKKMDSLMKQFFPNRGTMPFKEPFDDFDFGFPNLFNQNFRNLDSIWRQRLKGQQKKFDSIFKRQHLQKEKSSTNKI